MKMERLLRLIGSASAVLAMVTLAPPAFSQNCALCYTQAASAGARMIAALRSGILVLIVPPTLMWFLVAAVAYSKRNQFKHSDTVSEAGDNW